MHQDLKESQRKQQEALEKLRSIKEDKRRELIRRKEEEEERRKQEEERRRKEEEKQKQEEERRRREEEEAQRYFAFIQFCFFIFEYDGTGFPNLLIHFNSKLKLKKTYLISNLVI